MAKKYTNKDVARIIKECGAIFLQEAQKIIALNKEENCYIYSVIKYTTSIDLKDARSSFVRAFNIFCGNNDGRRKISFALPYVDGITKMESEQAARVVRKYLENTYGIKCDYRTFMAR